MKIIKTLTDKDFGMDVPDVRSYIEMRSARVIILDKDKNILVLHSRGLNYHGVPGGGIKEGEDVVEAAKREVMEEAGCKIKNIRELGIIEEYRNQEEPRHQYTYYFLADLDGEMGQPHFEEDELIEDLEIVPMRIDKFLEILKEEFKAPRIYKGYFYIARHIAAMEEAKKYI